MVKNTGPTVNVHGKTYHLDRLNDAKLDHLIQLCDVEITNYERAIQNYPADRMEKYGRPFIENLCRNRDTVVQYRTARAREAENKI